MEEINSLLLQKVLLIMSNVPSIDNSLNDGLLANVCGEDDTPLVGAPNGGHETERIVDKSADLYGSQFPYKLHRLLDDAKCMGFEDVIAWTSDGRAFQIFDKEKLETLILPRYFSSGRFKTVRKQTMTVNLRFVFSSDQRHRILPYIVPTVSKSMEFSGRAFEGRATES